MNDDAIGIDKLDVLRLTMTPPLVQNKSGGCKLALKGVGLQFQFGAFKAVAIARNAHLSLGFERVLGLIELNAVGLNGQAGSAQTRIAFNHHVQIGSARDALALQKHRGLVAFLVGNSFLQHRADAQDRSHVSCRARARLGLRAGLTGQKAANGPTDRAKAHGRT